MTCVGIDSFHRRLALTPRSSWPGSFLKSSLSRHLRACPLALRRAGLPASRRGRREKEIQSLAARPLPLLAQVPRPHGDRGVPRLLLQAVLRVPGSGRRSRGFRKADRRPCATARRGTAASASSAWAARRAAAQSTWTAPVPLGARAREEWATRIRSCKETTSPRGGVQREVYCPGPAHMTRLREFPDRSADRWPPSSAEVDALSWRGSLHQPRRGQPKGNQLT